MTGSSRVAVQTEVLSAPLETSFSVMKVGAWLYLEGTLGSCVARIKFSWRSKMTNISVKELRRICLEHQQSVMEIELESG
jgi:hypothetical protein